MRSPNRATSRRTNAFTSYAGLAMTYALAYQLGWDDETALGRAAELAVTAEQMDPSLPDAHWVLGFVETQRRRHADAIRHLHAPCG